MSARVLVTGATGFIGGRLAARLASSAREVRCLVRDRGGTRARALERAGFDLHEGRELDEVLERAAEAIEFGDDELVASAVGGEQRLVELRPIREFARRGLDEICSQPAAASASCCASGCWSRVETRP